MPVQILLGFNATHPGKLSSWTEVHFLPGINSPDDAAAKLAAVNLANARVDLLGSGVYLNEVRLSATDILRDSVQLPVGEVGNPESAKATPDPATLTAYGRADLTNVCVRLRMGASSKKWKNMYMAGIPDLLTNTALKTVDLAAVPLWGTKFQIWKNLIAPKEGGPYGFFALADPANATFAPKPIKDYTVEGAAPGRLGVKLLTADTGWTVGAKIHIRKVVLLNNAYRSPVGVWTIGGTIVDAPSGMTTYFLRNSEGINIDNIKELGTAELVGKTYWTYTFATILGLGTRKRGVSSAASHGRSRKKAQKA